MNPLYSITCILAVVIGQHPSALGLVLLWPSHVIHPQLILASTHCLPVSLTLQLF